MAVGDKIKQLDEQVVGRVRRTVEDLQRDLGSRLDEATDELRRRVADLLPRLTESLPVSLLDEDALRRVVEETTEEALRQARQEVAESAAAEPAAGTAALRSAVAEIDRARGQAGALDALVEASGRFAGRVVVLLVKPDGFAGWTAHGFEADAGAVRGLRLGREEADWQVDDGPRHLRPAECAALCSRLDSPLPAAGLAVPLVLRDKTAAVLYADTGDGERVDADSLQLLTYATALALETLAFRERDATSTLADAAPATPVPPPAAELEEVSDASLDEIELELDEDEAPAANDLLQPVTPEESATPPHGDELAPAPAPAPAVGATDEAETTGASEEPTDELLPYRGAPFEERTEEPPYGETAPADAAEEAPDVSADDDALADAPELEPEPVSTIHWTTEPEPAGAEPEEDEAAGATDETWPGAAPEPAGATTAPAGTEDASGPAPAPSPPASSSPAAPAPPPVSGSPEVQPPSDVEGPGWAFSGREPIAADDEPAHAEARRYARLLVSEIKLYNEDAVEAGRVHRDLYERLKDEIDRSRETYEKRVDPEVRDTTDYFYQELVRQLGAGDARVLGI